MTEFNLTKYYEHEKKLGPQGGGWATPTMTNQQLDATDLAIIYHSLKDFKNSNPQGNINDQIDETMEKIKVKLKQPRE